MKQLTLRGFGPDLEHALRVTARRLGSSLNKAALHLMRRGAGLRDPGEDPERIGPSIDKYAGTWSEDEARELVTLVAELDAVPDEGFWR